MKKILSRRRIGEWGAVARKSIQVGVILLAICHASVVEGEAVRTVPAAGPLVVSDSNPRYFSDNHGQIVYLTGSTTWDNFQDWGGSTQSFDYEAYLDLLERNNHNFIRMWVWEDGAASSNTSPLAWERTGPGRANDGRPRYDLTKFNEAYFERLRTRVLQAAERGIYVSIMLFQEYGDWRTHPLNSANNINGIDGDRNKDGNGREIHTLTGPDILLIQEAYVRKVIDTVNDLDNVLYEVGNELQRDTLEWQYHMIKSIRDYQAHKPKQHPVGMTTTGGCGLSDICIRNKELFDSPADWISPHVEPGQDYTYDPPAADGRKVIITDTDHLYDVLENPTVEWVWKSFLRGLNPILMDVVQNELPGNHGKPWNDPNDPALPLVRLAMGHTRAYANRINLARMFPQNELASTNHCLADPGSEYLIYLPPAPPTGWLKSIAKALIGTNPMVTVDLSASSGKLHVEWFNPRTGKEMDGGSTNGGGMRSFSAPFTGDAVLYLYRSDRS